MMATAFMAHFPPIFATAKEEERKRAAFHSTDQKVAICINQAKWIGLMEANRHLVINFNPMGLCNIHDTLINLSFFRVQWMTKGKKKFMIPKGMASKDMYQVTVSKGMVSKTVPKDRLE